MPGELLLQPRIRKLLDRGIRHHQAGRTQSAEECYRRALRADPGCAPALLCRGLVAQQAGRYADSIDLINRALALEPDNPDWLGNLAYSYYRQGEHRKAKECYRRVAELRPKSSQAHYDLGSIEDALEEWEAATESFERAIALEPDSAKCHCGLARVLQKRRLLEESAAAYRRALALDPTLEDAWNDLGIVLADLKQFEAACAALRRAEARNPASAVTAASFGHFHERQGELEAAAECYRRAVTLDARLAKAHLQLGIVLAGLGRRAEGLASMEEARRLDPECATAKFSMALLHLLQGQLALGWEEYEARWKACRKDSRKLPQPLWQGEPLAGTRILLWAEQGLGDTLQFVRYVPRVSAAGAQVLLEVQPRLRRLLENFAGTSAVVTRGDPLPQFDWQCPLLSLPRAFATDIGTIPAEVPYIFADPAQEERWRRRLAGDAVRIGLAWSGSPQHDRDEWRTVPLSRLEPLLEVEGATFYSLQVGPGTEQIRQLGLGARLIDLAAEQEDFADAAAIVANLDLVVSIDTSIAHLAGAMGKPVWVLLAITPDWRWFLERDDSPWYPTARLFRQRAPGAWDDPVSHLARELRRFVALRRGTGQEAEGRSV